MDVPKPLPEGTTVDVYMSAALRPEVDAAISRIQHEMTAPPFAVRDLERTDGMDGFGATLVPAEDRWPGTKLSGSPFSTLTVGQFDAIAARGDTFLWDDDHPWPRLFVHVERLDADALHAALLEWFSQFLEVAETFLAERDLRAAVEVLVTLLHREVLENAELLRSLDEHELVEAQLRAQVEALQAELARARVSPARVRPAAKFVGALFLTAAAAFGGNATREAVFGGGDTATADHEQVVQLPEVDHQLSEVLRLCGAEPPDAHG